MNIKEVSKKTDTSVNTIRYLERLGLIPQVKRDSYGLREFNEEDIKWIYFVKQMREVNLSIEGLIEYVELFSQTKNPKQAKINLLMEQKNDLQDQINRLEAAKARLIEEIRSQTNEES